MFKTINFFLKKKNLSVLILYLLIFFLFLIFIYLSSPKFFNISKELLEKNLKTNHNINLSSSTNFKYQIFPTPRIIASDVNLNSEDDIFQVENSEISFVLKFNKILDFKNLNYKKLIISKGNLTFDLKSSTNVINFLKKNNKKIIFENNQLYLTQENEDLIVINNSRIQLNSDNLKKELVLNGLFLDNKINLFLTNLSDKKNNLILKIPSLDINANVVFEKNNQTNVYDGTINIQVLNNLLFFKFFKDKSFNIEQGYIRNDLINSSILGDIILKPNFFINLTLEPNYLKIKKIFNLTNMSFFKEDYLNNIEMLKKINGSVSIKQILNGEIIFENNQIILKNFYNEADNNYIINAQINEYGKKGKIRFQLTKKLNNKDNVTNNIEIIGYLIPFESKIIFNQISLDNVEYSIDQVEELETKFNKEVIEKSLDNLFEKAKLDNFFKSLIN